MGREHLGILKKRTIDNDQGTIILCVPDVQTILKSLGSDGTLLKKSILIGCSEQNQVQFCLDISENTLNVEYSLLQLEML